MMSDEPDDAPDTTTIRVDGGARNSARTVKQARGDTWTDVVLWYAEHAPEDPDEDPGTPTVPPSPPDELAEQIANRVASRLGDCPDGEHPAADGGQPEPTPDDSAGGAWDDGLPEQARDAVMEMVEGLEPGERKGAAYFNSAYLMMSPLDFSDIRGAFTDHPDIRERTSEDGGTVYERA